MPSNLNVLSTEHQFLKRSEIEINKYFTSSSKSSRFPVEDPVIPKDSSSSQISSMFSETLCFSLELKIRISKGLESIEPNFVFLTFPIFVVSLSVCNRKKYCRYFKMAKLNSKNKKKSLFYKEKVC